MERAHVDITRDLEDEPVVHAVFDLREEEIGASAHAVAASIAERFRNEELSADDVVEFRELTALADELSELVGGAGTIVMRPARLNAFATRSSSSSSRATRPTGSATRTGSRSRSSAASCGRSRTSPPRRCRRPSRAKLLATPEGTPSYG